MTTTPLDDDIFTAETADDALDGFPLGMTSFLGHLLTPEQTEALAARLLGHAQKARAAVAPGHGTGPTQAEWEQGWIDQAARART